MRRGVVLGLIVLCVLLFTSYFRESEGGVFHRVKGTVSAIVAPVQDVSVAAVQPLKDGWNWFAELRDARAERDALRFELEGMRSRAATSAEDAKELERLQDIFKIRRELPTGYRRLVARVSARPPFDYARRAQVNRGSSDGVVANALVFAANQTGDGASFPALVGIVTDVQPQSATVTFVTDPTNVIAATVTTSTKSLGLLKAGSSGQLRLENVPVEVPVTLGDTVVTLGSAANVGLPSYFPSGLRIGTVVGVSPTEPGKTQEVQVRPYRDPVDLAELLIGIPVSPEAKRRAGP